MGADPSINSGSIRLYSRIEGELVCVQVYRNHWLGVCNVLETFYLVPFCSEIVLHTLVGKGQEISCCVVFCPIPHQEVRLYTWKWLDFGLL